MGSGGQGMPGEVKEGVEHSTEEGQSRCEREQARLGQRSAQTPQGAAGRVRRQEVSVGEGERVEGHPVG